MRSTLRYVKVADAIRRSILNGQYTPGERLPHQHDLAKQHGVSFGTLKHALDLLSDEGHIIRKVGRGTFASFPEPITATALVVDDELEIRELLTRSLQAHNWNATAAESGESALALLQKQSFDLIFLDLMMPGMNGAQTCRKIRDRDSSAHVVIVTGFPDSKLLALALETGPLAVMLKPFTMQELGGLLNDNRPIRKSGR